MLQTDRETVPMSMSMSMSEESKTKLREDHKRLESEIAEMAKKMQDVHDEASKLILSYNLRQDRMAMWSKEIELTVEQLVSDVEELDTMYEQLNLSLNTQPAK